ncbi:FAD:protein FMN transferase, partial [Enterococcus faecalis]|nr:FAD:protein FMN transferase [Enterococcus faecalis]
LEEAAKRAAAFEQRFSANDPTSELMQINQQAGQGAIAATQELFELIALGKAHSVPKDSYLNIAIGPLVQEWRIGFQDAHLPTPEKIAELLPKTDPAKIILDETLQTVGLAAGMKLDLGAVAKGYFADLLMT